MVSLFTHLGVIAFIQIKGRKGNKAGCGAWQNTTAEHSRRMLKKAVQQGRSE
jgi:hypothetical protein